MNEDSCPGRPDTKQHKCFDVQGRCGSALAMCAEDGTGFYTVLDIVEPAFAMLEVPPVDE